jgi:hypothetical protein
MKNLPNFLIIGPPKCASTSLHYYLGQHADVYVSDVKETNFFTHDYYKGLDFYSTYFSHAGSVKAIGEATPSYFFLPFAIDRIKKDLPAVKLIVTFRNPIERAFSHWLMFKEEGKEKKSFSEAININLKQMDYVDFSGDNGADLWNNRRDAKVDNEDWIRIYLQASLYAENLQSIYNKFNKEQVHIIFLDDLKNNFQLTMKNVFDFLGVDKKFDVLRTESKNAHFNKKYFRWLQSIIGFKNAKYISGMMPDDFKNFFRQKKNNAGNMPVIQEQDKLFLQDFFMTDIKNLEKITNRNLSNWLINKNDKITVTE